MFKLSIWYVEQVKSEWLSTLWGIESESESNKSFEKIWNLKVKGISYSSAAVADGG